jgi:hypothetical protein
MVTMRYIAGRQSGPFAAEQHADFPTAGDGFAQPSGALSRRQDGQRRLTRPRRCGEHKPKVADGVGDSLMELHPVQGPCCAG